MQLIDGSSFWEPMPRSLGDKRREIPPEKAQDILQIREDYRDGDTRMATRDGRQEEKVVSRIFPAPHFGFRKITVERPLRLNFQASPERIDRVKEERAFQALAKSRKRGQAAADAIAGGLILQEEIFNLLSGLQDTMVRDRAVFDDMLDDAAKAAGLKLSTPVRKAILAALSERDESAAICRKRDGSPEPDPDLRDTERVPLAEDVNTFFAREGRTPLPGRLDRRVQARRQGWAGGYRWLRDKFQPLLLPVRPAARAGRDRERHPED